MKLTFNTLVVDLSTTLNAIYKYQSGDFRGALESLQEVLDIEPDNWDARLMLGACYYKTGQYSGAHRIFQAIVDRTPDESIRWKAKEGMDTCAKKMDKKSSQYVIPAEFGCHAELGKKVEFKDMSWM